MRVHGRVRGGAGDGGRGTGVGLDGLARVRRVPARWRTRPTTHLHDRAAGCRTAVSHALRLLGHVLVSLILQLLHNCWRFGSL